MFEWATAGPLPSVLGSVLPSLVGWLTLTLALTWIAAGLILLFFGWLSLPSRPEEQTPSPEKPSRSTLRVLGGAGLAIGAVLAGTYVLDHGSAWDAFALGGLGTLLFLGYEGFTRIPFAAGVDRLRGLADWLLGFLTHAFHNIAFWAHEGIAWIVREGAVVWPIAVSEGASIWQGRGYALVNLVAIALTVAVGGFAGWMSSSSKWRASGVMTFLGVDFLALGLVGFSLLIVERAHGAISTGLGIWLLGVELLGLFLFLAYQFYTLEFLAGEAGVKESTRFPVDPAWTPTVLVQVASYNEPPEIVEHCLDSTLRLDYPPDKFSVQLVDDSTNPETISRLRAFCLARGIDYRHRTDRRGFKGGALNDGLRALTRPIGLIAIVDSDYLVEPGFLRAAVQPFRDETVGFVQTPQAYRNAGQGTFARWYALADAYFYRVIQPVRARAQSLVFCGTMGVLRRTALDSAGGWSETCVTEDAELSLRLLAAGWKGEYIPTILGWGLAPDLMSAVRSQHRRWAFGGMQMLRMNREKLSSAHLSLRQRVDFKMGGLFWVDGIFLIGVTAALASLVVATWFGHTLPIGSVEALAVLASAPLLLMLDGLAKVRLALRATTRISFKDVLGITAFWYAIKINDLRAALRGWWGAPMPFVRTPKDPHAHPGRATALGAALRGSAVETAVAAALVTILGVTAYRWGVFHGHPIALGSASLLVWLGYYASAFASAPAFDYFSRRSVAEPVLEKTPGGSSSLVATAPSIQTPANLAQSGGVRVGGQARE